MSAQKQNKAKAAIDGKNITEKLLSSVMTGTTDKLFEDDYFIFELIKLLYDDSLEVNTKLEILTVIEQYACGIIPLNSVDQVVTALLDIYQDAYSVSLSLASQLLITVTTLFISNDELMGLLWRWRDTLIRLMKEEKSDICQDYMVLLITVISYPDPSDTQEQSGDKKTVLPGKVGKDTLSAVSQIMDNMSLLSPAGLITVVSSISDLVKTNKDLHPTIFKALILQFMSSSDPCVIYTMMYLQKEFRGQILSPSDEKQLLNRALTCVNLASVNSSTRLMIGQWLLSFLSNEEMKTVADSILKDMSPVVFDPLDVHTLKLSMINFCSRPHSQDVSESLHYLKQLAETTGGVRVTCQLFRLLFLQVTTRSSPAVQNNVLRITKKLFQNFPHLIPMIVDFLRAVKESQPHEQLHREILTLLHDTVLSLPIKTLLGSYQNYLQVWVLSAQDGTIVQQASDLKPLRRLLELVQEARFSAVDDWFLGCLVLSICRTMILHHHTDLLYTAMGDLLYFMMDLYSDCDVRDQARLLYTILTLQSDAKAKELLGATLAESLHLGENITDFFPGSVIPTKPAEFITLNKSPVSWLRKSVSVKYETTGEKLSHAFPEPVTDNLLDYWDKVYHLKTVMLCNFTIKLISDSDFDSLVAISFLFSEDKNMDLLEESKDVIFKMSPRLPDPLSVNVRAQFGFSHKTYDCDLVPVTFDLRDFLLPFPWNYFNIEDKQAFFRSHWENYTDKSHGKFEGVESVKILQCSRNVLLKAWENGLLFTCKFWSFECENL
ncbi:hypothetical protein Btru_010054 [Bulinus truncatus]|nr:hypothetical protein Btru_010054 [Bulinus truncatus]